MIDLIKELLDLHIDPSAFIHLKISLADRAQV